MIYDWRKAVADRPGRCIRCGSEIKVDSPIVYRKNEHDNWERAHLVCIPIPEIEQKAIETAVKAGLGEKSSKDTDPMLEQLELAVIALTEISKGVRYMGKDLVLIHLKLSAIEEKMRK